MLDQIDLSINYYILLRYPYKYLIDPNSQYELACRIKESLELLLSLRSLL